MQRIGAVVGRELIALAVDLEAALGDAVGKTPHGGAEEAPEGDIAVEVFPPQHHVGELSGAIGRENRLNSRAIGDDAGLETVLAAQPHHFNRAAVRQMPETSRTTLGPPGD